jgi:DNA-binding NtrC family response regulator/pSer/pThr/pTyr-binding forkhead associated (FHA) protein
VSSDRKPPVGDTIPLTSGVGDLLDRARVPRRRVLLLVYHRDGVATIALTPSAPVVVGREAPSDLVVPDASLSRRHARFEIVDGEVVVHDLGSTNGTLVDGSRIESAVIKPGAEVMLGALTAAVHVLSGLEDTSLGLESYDALRSGLEGEIQRARFFGRTLAVMMVLAPRDSHLRRWCPRLRELLRPVDRAAVYSPDAVVVLLPEVTTEQSLEVARAIVEPRPDEPALVCGIAPYPGAATTPDKLVAVSREAARAATASEPVRVAELEGPRSWLPRDRRSASLDDERITSDSPRMRAVLETALKLARSAIPVLLQGETGTGKEVLSRLVHEGGPRRDKPMICINCGGIPSQLVESTLFGHEKGAFTGATQQHKGVFEAADGGTVLLDEVGELPAVAQATLLRVLETKRITRVGSTKEVEVDVRVLAATHRDLEAMCEKGNFRLDLLYRLNAMTLAIPPLRERREDIAPLAMRFLRQASEANESNVRAIDPDAIALLEGYSWPGNVRELKNAIERAAVITEGDTLAMRDLPERVRAALGSTSVSSRGTGEVSSPPPPRDATSARASGATPASSFKEQMERLEVEVIVQALRDASGSQTEAARLLKLPLRTLQHKIKTLGIKKLGYAPPP